MIGRQHTLQQRLPEHVVTARVQALRQLHHQARLASIEGDIKGRRSAGASNGKIQLAHEIQTLRLFGAQRSGRQRPLVRIDHHGPDLLALLQLPEKGIDPG